MSTQKPLFGAEVKALKETVAAADAERDRLEADRDRIRGERDWRDEQVMRVQQVRVWRNEDGREFVFADDLRAALDRTPEPGA